MIKKSVLFMMLLSGWTMAVYAQSGNYYLGISSHLINFETSDYLKGNWQDNWGPTKLSVGIPLNERFSVMPTASFGKANFTGLDKNSFWNVDANLKYDLSLTRVQPYVMLGGGVSRINEKSYGAANAGLGLNFWVTEGFGFNAQTNYNLVPSFENYFQNSLGIIFRTGGGPRDSDKDGIPDDSDACPKVKGSASAQGCPDADGDGVKDSDDKCPNEAGTMATFGCPDADGDGIPNAQDNCPTVAGLANFNGCPDSDGDGIIDQDDRCPSEKGTAALKGCPDTDGDGIADKDDSCPAVKGTEALKGCPDADGDGIADKDDNCPDQPGTLDRKGCPEIKAEEVKAIEAKLNIAAKKIQFETGSAKIKTTSYGDIDQIVEIMKQYTFTRFAIEGHTDNTGKADANKALSQQRADAVKSYIAQKGIDGNRLQAVGYGSDKPIAANTTAAGRAQNRRVEIHLNQ